MLQLTTDSTAYTPAQWRECRITHLETERHACARRHNLVLQHLRRMDEYIDNASRKYLSDIMDELKYKMKVIKMELKELKNG